MSHPPIVLHGAPNQKPLLAASIVVVRALVDTDDAPEGAESFVRFVGDVLGEGWFVTETVDEIANLLDARRLR